MTRNRLLSLLGLAYRGRNLVYGWHNVTRALADKKARVVFVAGDCSDNAKRRIRSRAVSADIPLIEVEHGKDELGAALGKTSCSTVAITDAGLALLALEHIDTKGEHEEIKRKLKTIKRRKSPKTGRRRGIVS
jgi:ribosomal protein L7Ae-like RNA K-turn-binding protein